MMGQPVSTTTETTMMMTNAHPFTATTRKLAFVQAFTRTSLQRPAVPADRDRRHRIARRAAKH
jgi:hypothetical protein